MPTVRVKALTEVTPSLPEIETLAPTTSRFAKQTDLFLCALGFEPRCASIPEFLAQNGFKAARALYFEYNTNRADNQANRAELVQQMAQLSPDVVRLDADEQGAAQPLRNLLASTVAGAAAAETQISVLLDVSVASSALLMTCMKVLLEFDVDLKILYAEAAVYHPTHKEYELNPTQWRSSDELGLERGVGDVIVSDEYAGYHIDQLPDCVLVFPTFKKERALAAISKVDPSLLTPPTDKVVWLLGVPHLPDDQWRLTAMREINQLSEDHFQREVSTFDYRDALRTLEEIYLQRLNTHRFTLAPMGSKMQGLGAALFCYLHPDVRVIFASPKEYNASQYSKGCKARWAVDFGSLQNLRRVLDTVGMAEIEESAVV